MRSTLLATIFLFLLSASTLQGQETIQTNFPLPPTPEQGFVEIQGDPVLEEFAQLVSAPELQKVAEGNAATISLSWFALGVRNGKLAWKGAVCWDESCRSTPPKIFMSRNLLLAIAHEPDQWPMFQYLDVTIQKTDTVNLNLAAFPPQQVQQANMALMIEGTIYAIGAAGAVTWAWLSSPYTRRQADAATKQLRNNCQIIFEDLAASWLAMESLRNLGNSELYRSTVDLLTDDANKVRQRFGENDPDPRNEIKKWIWRISTGTVSLGTGALIKWAYETLTEDGAQHLEAWVERSEELSNLPSFVVLKNTAGVMEGSRLRPSDFEGDWDDSVPVTEMFATQWVISKLVNSGIELDDFANMTAQEAYLAVYQAILTKYTVLDPGYTDVAITLDYGLKIFELRQLCQQVTTDRGRILSETMARVYLRENRPLWFMDINLNVAEVLAELVRNGYISRAQATILTTVWMEISEQLNLISQDRTSEEARVRASKFILELTEVIRGLTREHRQGVDNQVQRLRDREAARVAYLANQEISFRNAVRPLLRGPISEGMTFLDWQILHAEREPDLVRQVQNLIKAHLDSLGSISAIVMNGIPVSILQEDINSTFSTDTLVRYYVSEEQSRCNRIINLLDEAYRAGWVSGSEGQILYQTLLDLGDYSDERAMQIAAEIRHLAQDVDNWEISYLLNCRLADILMYRRLLTVPFEVVQGIAEQAADENGWVTFVDNRMMDLLDADPEVLIGLGSLPEPTAHVHDLKNQWLYLIEVAKDPEENGDLLQFILDGDLDLTARDRFLRKGNQPALDELDGYPQFEQIYNLCWGIVLNQIQADTPNWDIVQEYLGVLREITR